MSSPISSEDPVPVEPSSALGPGPRTTLRRRAQRGSYDRAQVYAIIDEAVYCHLAFAIEGQAHALPTAHARMGDRIVLHGAMANRMLAAAKGGAGCCLTFTLLDGLVLARSAYHHSLNYRCAVVYGQAEAPVDAEEKRLALEALMEHIAKGRSAEVRAPSEAELNLTQLVFILIVEASAKIRSGPVVDDEADTAADSAWAGIVPLAHRAAAPERDAACTVPFAQARSVAQLGLADGRAVRELSEDGVCYSDDRTRLDVAWVHAALTRSYWAEGVSLERVWRSVVGSLCFAAYQGGSQVGFARVLSDGARIGYLADVYVEPGLRGRGIGRRLVSFALAHPEVASLDRLLLRTRDKQSLYSGLGFVSGDGGHAMVLTRS